MFYLLILWIQKKATFLYNQDFSNYPKKVSFDINDLTRNDPTTIFAIYSKGVLYYFEKQF